MDELSEKNWETRHRRHTALVPAISRPEISNDLKLAETEFNVLGVVETFF